MKQKNKVILSLVLFVMIFAGLLITATFTDLQISHILTRSALANHEYYTNDNFGAGFESIGTSPTCLMVAFACEILFWFFINKKLPTIIKLALSGAAFGGATYFSIDFVSKIMGYVLRHVDADEFNGDGWLSIVIVFIGLVILGLGIMSVHNFSDKQIEMLFGFAVATILVCIVESSLVEAIKIPAGRIRYRAMNMYPDNPDYGFAAFQKWYEFKGEWMDKDTLRELFTTSDAIKSFPSGHTSGAASLYCLMMIPTALQIKKKWATALFWICPILFVGAVAVSRIIVGAHFFSDVLVGGTISFVCVFIFREIFVCKLSNIKALIGKN